MTIYRFASYQLDTSRSELFHDEELVKTEPQVISILEMLITNHGELVSKEEIIKRIWSGRIITTAALDNRIKSARSAIGDNGRDQTLIKTYPTRGYKFIGEVTVEVCESAPQTAPATLDPTGALSPAPPPAKTIWRHLGRRKKIGLGAIVGVFLVFTLSISLSGTALKVSEPGPDTNAVNLTTLNPAAETPKNTYAGEPVSIAVLPVELLAGDEKEHTLAARHIGDRTTAYLSAFSRVMVSQRAQGETPDTDYTLKTSLSFHEARPHLTSSLSDTKQSSVMWTHTYTLPENETDDTKPKEDWQERLSRSAALSVANALGISVARLKHDHVSFDAYTKYQAAVAHGRSTDLQRIKLAEQMLQEVIANEPAFLPAYAALYDTYVYASDYSDEEDHYTALTKMQAVYTDMKALAPDSAETIIAKVILTYMDGSYYDRDTYDTVKLLRMAVDRAPDYFRAQEELAHALFGEGWHTEALDAYNAALESRPMCPILLAGKSESQNCTSMADEAWSTALTNIRHNSDSQAAAAQTSHMAYLRGEYYLTQSLIAKHLEGKSLGHHSTPYPRAWYLAQGDYDTAMDYVSASSTKAYIAALQGDRETALREAALLPAYYHSALTHYILDNHEPMHKLVRSFINSGEPIYKEGNRASVCDLNHAARDAYILSLEQDPIATVVKANLKAYYDGRSIEKFYNVNEYTGLIGLHILNNEPLRALEVFSAANDKGFIFLHLFADPLFKELQGVEGFDAEYDRMVSRAQSWRQLSPDTNNPQ